MASRSSRRACTSPTARAKVEIALASGKDVGDKRETIKKRDMQRDMDRAIRDRE